MSTDAADDDDGAPTTLSPQPSPSAHPVQEKISRSGEPLTLTNRFCEEYLDYYLPVKIANRSEGSLAKV